MSIKRMESKQKQVISFGLEFYRKDWIKNFDGNERLITQIESCKHLTSCDNS